MSNFFSSDSALKLIDVIVPIIIGILGTVIAYKSSNSDEKGISARIMYEKVYHPIYTLIEDDLYKNISYEKALFYGHQIADILSKTPQYFYPSLKLYNDRLISSDSKNYQHYFETVCWSVDVHIDKCSRTIGVPIRSGTYRLNMRQYDSPSKLFCLFMVTYGTQIALFIALIYLAYRYI